MKKRLLLICVISISSLALVFFGASKFDFGSPRAEGCPFCGKILLERQLVYRGDYASVLATHKPAVEGHLLIIPNRHVVSFDQLENAEILEIGALVKRVHAQYIRQFQTSEYLLIQKNGPLAGQSVPHVHVHILPRTKDVSQIGFIARFFLSPWLKPLDDRQMKEYVRINAE